MAFDYKKFLMQTFGFKEDQLAELEKDGMTDDQQTAVAAKLLTAYHTSHYASPEFKSSVKDPIEQAVLGRVTGETQRKLIKSFELELPDDDQKNLDKVITAAVAKVKKSDDHNIEDLRTQLTTAKGDVEKVKNEYEDKLKAKDTEIQNERTQLYTNNGVQSALTQLKLKTKPHVITPYVRGELEKGYSVKVDEKGNLIVRQKNNPEAPVYDGTKELSAVDIITKIVRDGDMLDDKQGGPGGTGKPAGANGAQGSGATVTGEFKTDGGMEGLKLVEQKLNQNGQAAAV